MTVANPVITRECGSLVSQLLPYANRTGIHMFEQSDKNLIVIGNTDQSLITLIFSFGGKIEHRQVPKIVWNSWFMRWFYTRWLIA